MRYEFLKARWTWDNIRNERVVVDRDIPANIDTFDNITCCELAWNIGGFVNNLTADIQIFEFGWSNDDCINKVVIFKDSVAWNVEFFKLIWDYWKLYFLKLILFDFTFRDIQFFQFLAVLNYYIYNFHIFNQRVKRHVEVKEFLWNVFEHFRRTSFNEIYSVHRKVFELLTFLKHFWKTA